jgi:hypothetical protein
MRECTRSLLGAALVSIGLCAASTARADVSCVDPANLCTGDPCVIGQPITVISPCVVDFGARTLVLAARVNVPNDGMLSFTAAAIDGFADIDGRHLDAGSGSGGEVELHANAGNVTLRGAIDVSGTLDVGSIVVTASGDILLDDRLDAKAVGFSASGPGGDVTLDAGGTLTTTSASFIDVRSANGGTPGGTVALQGDVGVELNGKIDGSGSAGGSVGVSSSGGAVTIRQSVRSRGASAVGGSVSVSAAGTTAIRRRPIDVLGATGGTISLSSSGADVVVVPNLFARGFSQDGGTVSVNAFGSFTLDRRIDARGRTIGGTVALAADTLRVFDRVRTGALQGGTIDLFGGTVLVDAARLEADGGDFGGTIAIFATVSADFVKGAALVDAEVSGGIFIHAPTVHVGPSADLNAGRIGFKPGGLVCLKATAGNMLVEGDVDARGAGVIEAAASGDLTANGDFRTDPGGCIGLSAGGTLNTAGGSFNPAPGPSCGVCPP